MKETNLIHLDILQRLLSSAMVLCDLSSRNPNVLFELGLRQAFDKPVVLVQEVGTPRIFDIAPLRYTEYRRARVYHEVLEDQRWVAQALKSTAVAFKEGTGVNSIVRILSLTRPATLPEVQDANRDPVLQLIRAELNELRSDLRQHQGKEMLKLGDIHVIEAEEKIKFLLADLRIFTDLDNLGLPTKSVMAVLREARETLRLLDAESAEMYARELGQLESRLIQKIHDIMINRKSVDSRQFFEKSK